MVFQNWFGRSRGTGGGRDLAGLAARVAAPAVHAVTTDAASDSHLGGTPGLPAGVAWPEREGVRLGFLARLSLAGIQRTRRLEWLPDQGALLFFYDLDRQPWGFDPADRGGAVVLHVGSGSAGEERGAEEPPFQRRNLAFRTIDTLPSFERSETTALGLSGREGDRWADLAEGVYEGRPKHQVGGFPAAVQNDAMELECQLVTNGLYCGDASGYEDPRAAALRPGAAEWRLLFQVDTDDDAGMMWGDCGTLYYWIREPEARAGDFTRPWLVLQCG